MTVVARGAAAYASTVERSASARELKPKPSTEALSVRLAFDPVSAEASTRVAGKLSGRTASAQLEVKMDAEGGVWTSGWQPVSEGFFETSVVLQEGRLNRFTLSLRDAKGRALAVEPSGVSGQARPLARRAAAAAHHLGRARARRRARRVEPGLPAPDSAPGRAHRHLPRRAHPTPERARHLARR